MGNVGQLTMDLFINETGADHVGYLHDDSILPMVGNHPLDCHNERTCVMTTAAQGTILKRGIRIHFHLQIRKHDHIFKREELPLYHS